MNGSVVGRGFTVVFSSAGLVFDTLSTGGFYLKFGDIGDHARAPYDLFILFH